MKSSLQKKIQHLKNPRYAAFYNWRRKHFYPNMIHLLSFISSFLFTLILIREEPVRVMIEHLYESNWLYPMYYLSLWELLSYKGMSYIRAYSVKRHLLDTLQQFIAPILLMLIATSIAYSLSICLILLSRVIAVYILFFSYKIVLQKTGVAYIHSGWLFLLPLMILPMYDLIFGNNSWLYFPNWIYTNSYLFFIPYIASSMLVFWYQKYINLIDIDSPLIFYEQLSRIPLFSQTDFIQDGLHRRRKAKALVGRYYVTHQPGTVIGSWDGVYYQKDNLKLKARYQLFISPKNDKNVYPAFLCYTEMCDLLNRPYAYVVRIPCDVRATSEYDDCYEVKWIFDRDQRYVYQEDFRKIFRLCNNQLIVIEKNLPEENQVFSDLTVF